MRTEKRGLRLSLALGMIALAAGNAHAGEELSLSPQHGPWLIYVTFFRGPDAQREATELARDLRKNRGLDAYTHSVSERKRQEDRIRRTQYNREHPGFRARRVRIDDEYAVLVGDYRSRESALRALERMKSDKSSWFSWPSFKWFKKDSPARDRRKEPNPLARSFVVPNPIATKEEKTFRIWD